MNKYNIEGGIDFFAELNKSLEVDDNEEIIYDYNNICLITKQPLTDKYVSLNCGHKFNYIPIYNDLVNHKQKFNYMECSSRKLNTNEIRCPYCRKKQQGLLPYYEELGLRKVNGVNFYDPYSKTSMYNKCEYQYPNDNYDPTKPETETNTPYLNNLKCHFSGFQIAVYNSQNPSQPINYGDTKCYCYNHKKMMIKYYKYQEKEKEKIEKKQAKELEKQKKILEKKQAKELEKQKKSLEKKQAKEFQNQKKFYLQQIKDASKILNNMAMSENIVLGPSIQSGCVQILKTGLNKGKPCGCKIFTDNMCKRHLPKNENSI
jgi:hypothetical protein